MDHHARWPVALDPHGDRGAVEAHHPFQLITSQTFESGVLNLVDGPDTSAPQGTYDDAKQHLTHAE